MTVFFKEDTLSGYSVAFWPNSVCAGDLDLDGFNDIAVGCEYAFSWGGVTILKNMGWGSFQTSDSIYSYSNAWFVKLAQLDNDPHPEMIFLKDNPNIPTEYIAIIFNNNLSDSLFLDTHTYDGIEYLATGDIDGNGYNDIVFASNNGHFWGVFYNYGNHIFSNPEIHTENLYYPSDLDCKDLNNDGRADVVLSGQIIDVYFSVDTGFINLHLDANGSMQQISLTDLDLDGYRDIIAANSYPNNQSVLLIYKNLGNNTFQRLPDKVYNIAFGPFFIADFNNDGLPDILFSLHAMTGYHLLYNQGDFQFVDSVVIPVSYYGEMNRSFYCLDLDNNGYADIITTRNAGNYIPANVDIQFNDGHGHFQPDPILGINNPKDEISSSFNIFPNPFNNEIWFKIKIESEAYVTLVVFDVYSKSIVCIESQLLKPGNHIIKWNGVDKDGIECEPGIYFATLKINNCNSITKKVIKL